MSYSSFGADLHRLRRAAGSEHVMSTSTPGTQTAQSPPHGRTDADPLFDGPGEMRALCRAFDWASTSLGPPADWPVSLRTLVGIVLGSRNPMFLFWGPDLIQFYNDAYRPSLGGAGSPESRHPRALGMRGRDFWTDIWDAIGPQIEQVMTTGEATWHQDQYLPIERDGRLDDVWWTYSYGPAHDDDGGINGVLVVCQETTARVRAENERERLLEEAARARRRLERILDQIADEHITLDADYRILTVNRRAVQALGRSREALIGLTHAEAFPASVGTHVEERYRQVVEQREEVHFTHHYVGEGYDRHLEVDAYPTDDGGVAIFWRDVSERVRAEEALRESESRYRGLFVSMDEGFSIIEVLFDDQGRARDYRFLDTNPAFLQHTGLIDAVGRCASELLPDLEPHWYATYGRVALTGEATRFEAGSEVMGRWFDVYAFRIGEPVEHKVALLFKDVTAARAAALERERLLTELDLERRRLAEAFRGAPSFLAVMRGDDHVFELVNDAYYTVVGHRDLIGKPLLEALPELRDQGFVELLDRVVETGEPYVGREMPIRLFRSAGAEPELRYVDFVYQPLLEADGTVSGVAAHGNDVTEQVLSRREIERLLAESERARVAAESANRVKAQFLATMSHELRTPLNAIAGYAELLQIGTRGPLTDDQRQYLDRIQQSQRHLLGLINEVLDFAKIETASVHYEIEPVPVKGSLAAAEALIAPQAQARGIELVPATCPARLAALADAEKLRQILVNLLSNAVKFSERGGRIEVTARSEDGHVRIDVSDTGIGIPSDKLDAIFDPFVQVHSDLTRPYEGTGLGLAISRELARGMKGDLSAASTPGKGSTFTLTLPLA
jgi:PAS domain S-box-containing protein